MKRYMLCYNLVKPLISFQSFYNCRVLIFINIWQIGPTLATPINSKTISFSLSTYIDIYIFVHGWKIYVRWTRFFGVITMDIKVHTNAIRKIVRYYSVNDFKYQRRKKIIPPLSKCIQFQMCNKVNPTRVYGGKLPIISLLAWFCTLWNRSTFCACCCRIKYYRNRRKVGYDFIYL